MSSNRVVRPPPPPASASASTKRRSDFSPYRVPLKQSSFYIFRHNEKPLQYRISINPSFRFKNNDIVIDTLFSSLDVEKKHLQRHRIEHFKSYIEFQGTFLQSLPQYLQERKGRLSYTECMFLLSSVGNQLASLERKGVVIPYLDPANILVVGNVEGENESSLHNEKLNVRFFYMNFEELHEINEDDGSIRIETPYKKMLHFSPELHSIDTLPSVISSKSWIFSLATIVIYCLTGETKVYIRSLPSYMKIMDMIENTKLYYALIRCLEHDPRKRILLIV